MYVTEVVADSVQFLEPKKESKPKSDSDPFSSEGDSVDINSDDLPF